MHEIGLGAAFYPEHWARDRLPVDVKLLKRSGSNVVRMGEFAWSDLEPEEGRYEFSWLENAVKMLKEAGIQTIIGTPTASPPPWLVAKHPDVLLVDSHGVKSEYGKWHEYCPNSPTYQAYTKEIVSALSSTFSREDAVIGYQIDNEARWGESPPWKYCYCASCIAQFRRHLAEKYADIDNLNEIWGASFWSHRYGSWDEISPPSPPYDAWNRSLAIEWVRFRSVSFERYLALQVNAVKNVSPGKFVTTNRMQLSSFVEVDSFELGRFMDFVSLDLYPKGRSDRTDPAWNAMQFAVARGSSKSGSFYVTELQAGQTDGHTVPSPEGVHTTMIGLLPEQGEMRDWFYQAVAHGSRANLFFNWRTNTRGKEQYWHGVLGHDGEPNDRYREMQKIGRELGPLSGAVLGSRLQSSVAVIMSFDSLWASDVIESGYHPVSYMQQLFASYRGLWNAGVVPQVIGPDADLKQFSLVVAPFMYLFDRRLASKIKSYVASGGFIVCTARSFVKDEYNRVMAESPPGILTNVLGFNLGRYSRLPLGEKETTIRVSRNPLTGSRSQIKCSGWIEELSPVKGAATMGVHDHPLLKGAPAMILHRYGKGRALTVGGFPDSDFYSMLGLKVNDGRRMEFRGGTGVEVVERTNGGRTTVFVMNHGSTERRLSYAAKGRVREVLSGTECGAEGKIVLPPHDVRLFHVDD